MTTPADPKADPKASDDPRALGRVDDRVTGPFDGRWVSALTVPVRIHDLSLGGCLIEAHHHQPAGRRISLEIELPFEGWVQLESETVYSRADYGFAVKFVEVPGETRERLSRVIGRLKAAQTRA
jgi:hypothetical protein